MLHNIVEKEGNTNTINKETVGEPTNYEAKEEVEQNNPKEVTNNNNDHSFESKEALRQTNAPQSTMYLDDTTPSQEAAMAVLVD